MRVKEIIAVTLLSSFFHYAIGAQLRRTLGGDRRAQNVGGGGNVFGQENGAPEEFEVVLEPFQLQLIFNDTAAMANSDEMTIFTTTQDFMSLVLQQEMSTFSRLALYQFVRDYPEEEHFAKVAISGMSFFFSRNMDPEVVQTKIYLSFVGVLKIEFITTLHNAGMENVVDVILMSVDGTELEYRDGQMVGLGEPVRGDYVGDEALSLDMSDDMRITTILMSLLIPGAVFCLACGVYAYRSAREINWAKQTTSPDAPVWQSSRQLRLEETESTQE